MMTELEQYYNKFNEEKRLDSRHGKVEFITSMKYIHEYLGGDTTKKILDIGAGTGKYSVALAVKSQKQQCKSLSGQCVKTQTI